MVKCEICGKEYIRIGNHIIKCHKISLKKYYDTYMKKDNKGICKECGQQTKFKSLNRGYYQFCSHQCSNRNQETKNKIRQENLKRYGGTGYESEEIRKKCENTCMKKYRYKYASKNEKIKKKISINRSLKNQQANQKYVQTCLQRYKCKNTMQVEKFKAKVKDAKAKKLYPKVLKTLQKNNLELLSEFTVWNNPIRVKCKKCHNIFTTVYFNLHQNCGKCKNCFPLSKSIAQVEIEEFLKKNLGLKILSNDHTILKDIRQEIDIYIPDLKIGIEYNSFYYHRDKRKNYHLEKTLKCQSQGTQLIHIFEDEWLNYQDQTKELLRKILLENYDLIQNDCDMITLNRRFSKNSDYYQELGYEVNIIGPKLYPNKEEFKVWDVGYLVLTKKSKI